MKSPYPSPSTALARPQRHPIMAKDDPPPQQAPASPKLDLSFLNGKSAMTYALHGLSDQRPRMGSEDSWTPEASSTVSEDDHASALKPEGTGAHTDKSRSTTAVSSDGGSIDVAYAGAFEKNNARRKSVQVVIEKSGKKGRYILTADDPEFREIIKSGIEREAEKLSGKSRNRIRDLVFTRQFTTFDRQNPRGSQSPFHGFFTLFWLAMALSVVKIAAQNYKSFGSVFGRAEILHLMVDRDLVVMLATDGLMCLSTVLCLYLQKVIAKEYLNWDRSGWIIQSLWEIFFTVTVIWVSFYREWSWTHTVFIVMHDFVLLMKQHSYAFYNGYCKLFHHGTSPYPTDFNQCLAYRAVENSCNKS